MRVVRLNPGHLAGLGASPVIQGEDEGRPPTRGERIVELVIVSVASSIITQVVMRMMFKQRR